MKMGEAGLLSHWEHYYFKALDSPCIMKTKKRRPTKISLHNLTPAFVVLGIGFVASLVTFVSELLLYRTLRKTRIY